MSPPTLARSYSAALFSTFEGSGDACRVASASPGLSGRLRVKEYRNWARTTRLGIRQISKSWLSPVALPIAPPDASSMPKANSRSQTCSLSHPTDPPLSPTFKRSTQNFSFEIYRRISIMQRHISCNPDSSFPALDSVLLSSSKRTSSVLLALVKPPSLSSS